MGELDEDTIQTAMAFMSGASRDVAISFLKRYKDLQEATAAFWDNDGILPPVNKDTWDETHFHVDRAAEYGPENRPDNSFNIHSSDALNTGIFGDSQKRPPSRVSNYASNTPKDLSEEDQMRRALELSSQEVGVTDSHGDGNNFRKAETSQYYDNANWAMTVSSNREVLENPSADCRKREADVPAMIKPITTGSIGEHYLPALMVILHAIPMAKEALLARDLLLPDYGNDKTWWDGDPIQATRIVHLEDVMADFTGEDLVHETQRIMAFLEKTERAYGSTRNIADIEAIKTASPPMDIKENVFLSIWRSAVQKTQPDYELANTFVTKAYSDTSNDLDPSTQLSAIPVEMNEYGYALGHSLYEQLDQLIWPSDTTRSPLDDTPLDRAFLEPAEVLVFVCTSREGDAGLGIDIPAVLNVDRYTEKSADAVMKLRKDRVNVLKQTKISEVQESTLTMAYNQKTRTDMDTSKLLEVVASYFSDTSERSGDLEKSEGMLVDLDDRGGSFTYGEVAAELREIAARVTEKVKSLENVRSAASRELNELSNLFKPSVDDETTLLSPSNYTLRGVSTTNGTTYVLANPNTADDLLDTPSSDWEWWKLTYDSSSSSSSPVSASRVFEYDVLLAAKMDSSKALLVYASPKAVSYPTSPLPSQLLNFVRTDNLQFDQELEYLATRNDDDNHHWANNHISSTAATQWNSWSGEMEDETPAWNADDYDEESTDQGQYSSYRPIAPAPPRVAEEDGEVVELPPAYAEVAEEKPLVPPRLGSPFPDLNGVRLTSSPSKVGQVGTEQLRGMEFVSSAGRSDGKEREKGKIEGQQRNEVPGGNGPGVGEAAKGGYPEGIRMEDVEE